MRGAWIALVLVLSACASDAVTVEEYVADWNDAWAEADPYDVARYYDPEVIVELAQGDNELRYAAGYTQDTTQGTGTAWLIRWLRGQVHPAERTVEAIVVGEESVLVMVSMGDTAVAYELVPGLSGISAQRTLRWRDAHKPAGEPDTRLDWSDDLVAEFLDEWPLADERLTAPGLMAIDVEGRSGPAVFVTPGRTTTAVAFFVETRDCVVAVQLDVVDQVVTSDMMWVEPDCADPQPAWAPTLRHPGELGEEVTAFVEGIELHSSTPELEGLVRWGLMRFDAVGAPVIDSVSFAPMRACEGVSGLSLDTGNADILLCTSAETACVPSRESCTTYRTSVRFALLHEMAHLWVDQHLDSADREGFMSLVDLEEWSSREVPWHERGVEQAAEILAWGLMDEEVTPVRIAVTCPVAVQAFEELTGSATARIC